MKAKSIITLGCRYRKAAVSSGYIRISARGGDRGLSASGDLRGTARHPQPFPSSSGVHPHSGFLAPRAGTKDRGRLRTADSH